MRRLSWCLLCVWSASSAGVTASAADKPIGKILPKSDLVVLRVGNRIVADVYSIAWPATAKKTDGRWLWVEDDGGSGQSLVGGWIRTDDIVPLGQGLEYFNARLMADSNSSSAYWLRGVCWEQAHEFGIASKDYEEAVRRDPFNRSAMLGWARTLAQHHQYDEQKFLAAYQANPSSPRLLVDWGSALAAAGHRDLARKKYERARQLNPSWPIPYYSLGKLAAEQKEYRQALDQYAEALRRDPSYHAVHRDRALAWLASKQLTFEEMQKILTDPHPDPDTATAWIAKHNAAETVVSALTSAHKACDLSSFRDSESLSVLAQAFAALGRWPEARRFEQMAVEYAPFHVKPTHMKRYFAYDRMLSPEVLLAENEKPRPSIEESKQASPAKPSGSRMTQSVVRPTENEEEPTIRESPIIEPLPQPAATTPRRTRFIDRSAMRFQ
jgi:tetratricopeptide (TPR) repeat protein